MNFNIFIDRIVPRVTRVYKDSEGLKIVTNEDAECAYSLTSCNFNINEGLKLVYLTVNNKMNHFVEWQSGSKYYIKCRDVFGNEPSPNACSIIVNTVELDREIRPV